MKPALFCIDAYFAPIAGLQTGKRWNGWHVPLFPMASCEAIARECPDVDGKACFRFDPVTRCWVQAPPAGCEEDGEWASTPVLVDGVEHWAMGDGYCWDEVGLWNDDCRTWRKDGVECDPSQWPLAVQAELLPRVWRPHHPQCSMSFEGSEYSFTCE